MHYTCFGAGPHIVRLRTDITAEAPIIRPVIVASKLSSSVLGPPWMRLWSFHMCLGNLIWQVNGTNRPLPDSFCVDLLQQEYEQDLAR